MKTNLVVVRNGDRLPAGSTIFAFWDAGTVLPSEDSLEGSVEPYGDPLVFSYLDRPHVAVKLSAEADATDLRNSIGAACAGRLPYLVSLDPSLGDAVDIQITGGQVEAAIGDIGAGITDTITATGKAARALPWIIGAVAVGAVAIVVGIGVEWWRSMRKGK